MSPVHHARRALGAAVLALASAALVGCGPEFDRLDITAVTARGADRLSVSALDIQQGLVVNARIVAYDDDGEEMPLRLRSFDDTVVHILGTTTPDVYVFKGGNPGTTKVEFLADDDRVLTVTATVRPQPDPG